jgi:hypothetical protein
VAEKNCEGEGKIVLLVDDIGAQLCQTRDTKNLGGDDAKSCETRLIWSSQIAMLQTQIVAPTMMESSIRHNCKL